MRKSGRIPKTCGERRLSVGTYQRDALTIEADCGTLALLTAQTMNKPLDYSNHDLATDPRAQRVRRRPVTVQVDFAGSDGTLETLEGAVRYRAGDALLTGSGNDRWPVARDVFNGSYEPVAPCATGSPGEYCKRPQTIYARRISDHPFTVTIGDGRDRLSGQPGDWLVQYGPGHYGIIAASRFEETYEL